MRMRKCCRFQRRPRLTYLDQINGLLSNGANKSIRNQRVCIKGVMKGVAARQRYSVVSAYLVRDLAYVYLCVQLSITAKYQGNLLIFFSP